MTNPNLNCHGQVLLEGILSLPLFLVTISGFLWLGGLCWKHTHCLREVFEATHLKRISSQALSSEPPSVEWVKTVRQCPLGTEEVRLPLLESPK